MPSVDGYLSLIAHTTQLDITTLFPLPSLSYFHNTNCLYAACLYVSFEGWSLNANRSFMWRIATSNANLLNTTLLIASSAVTRMHRPGVRRQHSCSSGSGMGRHLPQWHQGTSDRPGGDGSGCGVLLPCGRISKRSGWSSTAVLMKARSSSRLVSCSCQIWICVFFVNNYKFNNQSSDIRHVSKWSLNTGWTLDTSIDSPWYVLSVKLLIYTAYFNLYWYVHLYIFLSIID